MHYCMRVIEWQSFACACTVHLDLQRIGQSGREVGRVTRNVPTGVRKTMPSTSSSAALTDRQRRPSAASGAAALALCASVQRAELGLGTPRPALGTEALCKSFSPASASASGEGAADSDHESAAGSDSQSDRASGVHV